MNTIRVKKKIESETLHLPELRPMIGENVEITIETQPHAKLPEGTPYDALYELAGQDVVDPVGVTEADVDRMMEAMFALQPKREPPTEEEMEELRKEAENDEALAAVLELSESGGLDVRAIAQLRAASMK